MNASANATFVIVFVALALLLLIGSGTMTGTIASGGMTERASMGEIGWMWLPALLAVALGVLLIPGISGKK